MTAVDEKVVGTATDDEGFTDDRDVDVTSCVVVCTDCVGVSVTTDVVPALAEVADVSELVAFCLLSSCCATSRSSARTEEMERRAKRDVAARKRMVMGDSSALWMCCRNCWESRVSNMCLEGGGE